MPLRLEHPAGVPTKLPFSLSFCKVDNRKSLGHRPVDPCLSRRVSQGQPAGVPRILLILRACYFPELINPEQNKTVTLWTVTILEGIKEYLNQRGTKIRVFRVLFRTPLLPPFSPRFPPSFSFTQISGRNFLPELWERFILKLPLSKICAVPFALQNRADFEVENRAKRRPEKGRRRGGQQRGQKGKKDA